MSAGLALQYAAVALAVVASAGVVVHDRFPAVARRARSACAQWLLRPARPAWQQAVGKRIAPRPLAAGACGTCHGCRTGE